MDEISNTPSARTFEKHLEKDSVSSQLQIIQFIKNISSKNLGFISIETLLDHTLSFQKKKLESLDNVYIYNYGKSLVSAVVLSNYFENKFILHFEIILLELNERDPSLKEKLVTYTWEKFQRHNFLLKNTIQLILNSSVKVFEKVVLDWLEKQFQMDYYVMLSSNIPKVFQLMSSILHEILKISEGSWRVLEVTSAFVNGVISVCQYEKKNFLKLYPKDCAWLVSLLSVPPPIYSLIPVKANLILNLILNEFQLDKNKISLLLSHFPQWIPVFKNFLITYDKK